MTASTSTRFGVVGYSMTMRSSSWSYCCDQGYGFESWETAYAHAVEAHDTPWLDAWEAKHGEPWQYHPSYTDSSLPPTHRGSGGNTGHLYIVELCEHNQPPDECDRCPRPVPPVVVLEHVARPCPNESGHGETVFCPGCFA